MTWAVKVIETETGKVVKEIKAATERRADKLFDGLSINLNHEKYHVESVELKEGEV